MAFLKYNTATSPGHLTTSTKDKLLADLDLTIYRKKSDGTWTRVGYSSTNNNNVEIVQMDNPTAGQYKLVVTRADRKTDKVYFGVAWW